MWVRQSSIRPVPSFARVPRHALDKVREELLVDGDDAHDRLDEAFEDFEEQQPIVASHVGQILSRPLSEPAMALGFFLSLSIWLAFEHTHGPAVQCVTADELYSTQELMSFDEGLRQEESQETLETADVIGMEQPALVEFVHQHMEATLDLRHADVTADELQLIYRTVLVEILALSYAVQAPLGFPVSKAEVLA